MTNSTPLSPQAQAVADATEILVHKGFSGRDVAAAALRAAADGWRAEVGGITQTDFIRGVLRSAKALDEIADELEGTDG